jgi:hypothetical protein
MELKQNQAALILEANDEGEISVNLAAHDTESLAAEICQVIAQKLSLDEKFQAEILAELDGE